MIGYLRQSRQDSMKNRRKKYCIDRKVQCAVAKRMVFHWVTFFFAASLILPLWHLILTGDISTPLSTKIFTDGVVLLVALASLLPYFIWDTIKYTNRITGPMYRIQRELRALAQGENAQPIKLRKGDFWHEVAEDFNAMLTRVASSQDEPDDAPDLTADALEESVPLVTATN